MIAFTPLRTKRLTARLNELAIEDAIYICQMRSDMHEAGTGELLKRIVEDDLKPRIGQVTDPRLWTVQERAFVVAHYITNTTEGDPNFSIGADGKFSDYMLDGVDYTHDAVAVGRVADDEWEAIPLLGLHAEAIERLIVEGVLPPSRFGWWIGAMGAQLWRVSEVKPDWREASDTAISEAIAARAAVFRKFPESEFEKLLFEFLTACDRMNHLFRIDFTDDGIAWRANEQGKKGVPGLPPARFQFASAVRESTQDLFGKPHRDGS